MFMISSVHSTNWWQKLKNNPLARFGAVLLIIFYIAVIAADFVAPYNPYISQADGSLLPPHKFIGQPKTVALSVPTSIQPPKVLRMLRRENAV